MQRDSPLRLLLLFALLTGTCVRRSVECDADQRSLLLDLKRGFSFVFRDVLESWKAGSDCCSWEGVTCDSDSGEVIKLDLSDRGISGNISSSLFELTSLQTLNLAYDEFGYYPLPQSGFEKLTELTVLNLSSKGVGSNPIGIGFTGQVPMGISRLTKLVTLDLSGNLMVSFKLFNPDLQTLVRNLSNLRELYLDWALFGPQTEYGPYDGAWGSAILTSTPQLQVLSLSNTNLGGVTEDVFRLRNLTFLDLSSNLFLSGTLPDFPKDSAMEVLSLLDTNISGSLPRSLGNLKNLTRLDISYCRMTGSIPFSIGDLTHLVYLDLSSNSFSGSIPTGLFTIPALGSVDLSDNQLSGQLEELSNPSSLLVYVDLSNNRLQGKIPNWLFQQPGLEYLSLQSNSFVGTVDLNLFSGLENLTDMDLSYNSLQVKDVSDNYDVHTFQKLRTLNLASCSLSQIPSFLRYQNLVQYLDISDNKISGEIPEWIWNNGTLASLNLSCNLFTYIQRPIDLFLTCNMQSLDLHSNMLQGPIPLPPPCLFFFDYSNNNFSSAIPSNISLYLNNTNTLLLSNNNLTGEIPSSICDANLYTVDLSGNNLGGSIPRCLLEGSNVPLLLNLRENQLQGTIPMHISEGCNLETLILSGNHLEGKVPRSLANCSSLKVLDLGNNYIVDSFPSWLGDSANLTVLILKSNGFFGPVELPARSENSYAFSTLQVLDLSSNRFDGILPSTFFKNLHIMMNLRSNNSGVALNYDHSSSFYQDTVTVTWAGDEISVVRILTILYTSIDFSNNSFEGEIPDGIGELQGLLLLNLSHNALTGEIPPAMGNLKQLERLDLSTNQLSGEIPQELELLTFLSFLNLSDNDLAGGIPQGNQFNTFSNSSFKGNRGLCGSPLSKHCGNSAPAEATPSPPEPEHSSVSYDIGLALSVGLGFGIGLAMAIVLQNISWKFWKRQSSNHFSSLQGVN